MVELIYLVSLNSRTKLQLLYIHNNYTNTVISDTNGFISFCFQSLMWLVGWFVGFYAISTFVGYLTPNPFLYRYSFLFKTIQFSISTQFNCQKHFYFKLFKQSYITIQFSVSTVLISKTVQFQIIQFSISTQFKCKYHLIVKNISISSYSV